MALTDDGLATKTAVGLKTLVQAGEVSPLEVVDAVLARIESAAAGLNCFITVCAEQAREQARRATERLARGEPCRALEGLPFSAKDLVDTAGVRTTFGSLIHRDNVPRTDAVAIGRLRAAGAILVGKTTTPEFGHKAFTDAPLFGETCNAWDSARTCGGSSGGAAAAVVRGLAPLGVATDGGGSTRIPAACNGAVGFKQSAGAIAHSQTPDPFGNYTYVTPMTRTVADTVMMFEVMSGPHPSDPWSYVAPVPGKLAKPDSLCGVRIGLTTDFGSLALSRAMRGALEDAAAALEARGASIEPLNEDIEPVEPLWRVINHATWRARFSPLLALHRDVMTPTLVRQVEMAQRFSAVDFQQATLRAVHSFAGFRVGSSASMRCSCLLCREPPSRCPRTSSTPSTSMGRCTRRCVQPGFPTPCRLTSRGIQR